MKVIYMFTLLMFVTITVSCEYTKPVCPEMPYYPQVQQIDYTMPGVSRIASYRTSDPPQQIITYYKDKLMSSGWVMVSETQEGFTADYISGSNKPPFSSSVVIASVQPGKTDFKVHLTMGGPYNWSNWCQSLRP